MQEIQCGLESRPRSQKMEKKDREPERWWKAYSAQTAMLPKQIFIRGSVSSLLSVFLPFQSCVCILQKI